MYYQNEPRFNESRAYFRGNLPIYIKDAASVINPDDQSDVSTHWVALYV